MNNIKYIYVLARNIYIYIRTRIYSERRDLRWDFAPPIAARLGINKLCSATRGSGLRRRATATNVVRAENIII